MGILIIIVIGVVVYFIIQKTRAKTSGGPLQETPLDILKRRYAKGEISREEYDRMKNDLQEQTLKTFKAIHIVKPLPGRNRRVSSSAGRVETGFLNTSVSRKATPNKTIVKANNERSTAMLNKAKTLKGYKLDGLDGEIGKVNEFYFDDRYWTIRYLVADTPMNWLMDRQVLISPYALVAVKREKQQIVINLTKKQIEDSPSLDTDKPVSRQFEEAYYRYYGWPMYWDGPNMWGSYPYIMQDPEIWKTITQGEKSWDPHLRSTQDVSDHHIQAVDGEIGHVEDFIIDDENTWAIRYLIIDTRNWWPGKKVLVSPHWIERISWRESKVFVNLSRETIKRSPEYTEKSLMTRDYENRLHHHYNRKGYWVDEPAAKEHSR